MATTKASTTEAQRQILSFIKQQGATTNATLAEHLDISYEAVRQQLRQLEAGQWITSHTQPQDATRLGRPLQVYTLSEKGEHLFPKAYDELVIILVETVVSTLGQEALRQVLTAITDEQVLRWATDLENKTLSERLDALKDFYLEHDSYMNVDMTGNEFRLVERNCPYLNVATRHPALCSVTLSTLTRLLGYQVSREARFQHGEGRCVFRVHLDQQVNGNDFRFAFEEEFKAPEKTK